MTVVSAVVGSARSAAVSATDAVAAVVGSMFERLMENGIDKRITEGGNRRIMEDG